MNKYEERRLRPPTLSHRLEYWSMRSLIKGLEKLDWNTACRIGERIGELGFSPFGIRRHVVERQIGAAFPELSHEDVLELARKSYRHLGRNAVEASIIAGPKAPKILDLVDRVEGWEHIQESVGRGRGTMGVAAHHGNWELLGAFLAANGVQPNAVVRGMDNRLFEDYVNENRARLGMVITHDTQGVRTIAEGLRSGRFIAVLADQGVLGLASSFVNFLGRPAKTPRGFAVFALRFESDAVFMDMLREPNGKFRVVFEPIQIERTGDKERDVDAMVERYSEILEKWVRQYPEQYFWQHRRWRRQPEGTPVELRDPTLKDPSLWTPSR